MKLGLTLDEDLAVAELGNRLLAELQTAKVLSITGGDGPLLDSLGDRLSHCEVKYEVEAVEIVSKSNCMGLMMSTIHDACSLYILANRSDNKKNLYKETIKVILETCRFVRNQRLCMGFVTHPPALRSIP
jgi:hypothetical protein